MSRKIAPTLRRLTEYPLQRGMWFPPGTTVGDTVAALRELRALLAVARAADALNSRVLVDVVTDRTDLLNDSRLFSDRLDRALARLRKVSGGTR